MKSIYDLTEFEIRALLGIAYPGWRDAMFDVMKEKVENQTRTIIFRSNAKMPSKRKFEAVLHENHDLDIYETYISTGSRGKIEIRNVVAYVEYLQSLE